MHAYCGTCPRCVALRDASLERKARLDADNERALSACPDREAAHELVARIEAICARSYSAGWMEGIERALWEHLLETGPVEYGLGTIAPDELASLGALSEACDGWWYWPVDDLVVGDGLGEGPRFIRREDWLAILRGDRG